MKGNYEALIAPRLMIMRIIIGALFMGATSFTVVATNFHFNKQPPGNPPPAAGGVPVVVPPQQPQQEMPIVGYIGVFLLTVACAARFFVPSMMQPQLPPPGTLFQGDAAVEESMIVEKLIASYQSMLIVLAAMAEGATFMLLVSLMIFDTIWALPISIFGLLWILSYFPTYDGLISYLDEHLLQWQGTKSAP